MRDVSQIALPLVLVGLTAGAASGHYNMLLPQSASAKRGEAVTLVYQWGHPFEHQLFNAPAPARVVVSAPDGKAADLTKALEKTTLPGAESKGVTAYRLKYTPQQRGDHVFFLQTPPIWMDEDKEFLQDVVKVVLHVQAQKGWDAAAREPFEMVPLTRPYGLQPGMVFQAQVLSARQTGKSAETLTPVAGTLVEVEPYHAVPPKELPPDEQITRTVKTDPNGIFTCTLTDPGWWCLTAQREAGTREHQGKSYPLRQRTTLWVYVDPKTPSSK